MSNLIDRQAAIDAMEQAKEQYFDRTVIIGKMQDIVNNLPSAQPEIIRCKECKHGMYDMMCKFYWCHGMAHSANWFCADAERRTE